MYKLAVKPLFDLILSIISLILLMPLFLVLAVLLAFTNKGNPFFIQPRVGKNGKIFNLIKFKTMINLYDSNGILLPEINRITTIGKFIRKTSFDELPQLVNVLKGNMSIIGPRPLLVEYLPLYDNIQRRRHDVKPGITGWAQVNGRNAIRWKEKFENDIYYVDNLSFSLDIKILFLTIKKTLQATDVNQSESVTMEKFNGK